MDDEEFAILVCKAIVLGVACLLIGIGLAHWMIWG